MNKREEQNSWACIFTPLGTSTEDSQSLNQFILWGVSVTVQSTAFVGAKEFLAGGLKPA